MPKRYFDNPTSWEGALVGPQVQFRTKELQLWHADVMSLVKREKHLYVHLKAWYTTIFDKQSYRVTVQNFEIVTTDAVWDVTRTHLMDALFDAAEVGDNSAS